MSNYKGKYFPYCVFKISAVERAIIAKILVWSECSIIILRERARTAHKKIQLDSGEKSLWIVEGFPFQGSIFLEQILFLCCCRSSLLCCNELRVVYEAVLVLVVGLQDRVDHVLQLFVLEDLGLGHRFPGFVVMV